MIQARDLLDLGKKDLLAMLCTGHPIDPHALDDKEYRGTSLGLPAWVERLTWKKFKKVFHRDRATGALRGWNVRLEQNELDGPCVPKQKRGRTVTFGHYRVVESASVRMPIECPQALIIHYGLGNNARLDPVRRVRDPGRPGGRQRAAAAWLVLRGSGTRAPGHAELLQPGARRRALGYRVSAFNFATRVPFRPSRCVRTPHKFRLRRNPTSTRASCWRRWGSIASCSEWCSRPSATNGRGGRGG